VFVGELSGDVPERAGVSMEGAFESGRESGLRLCDGGDGMNGAQCVVPCVVIKLMRVSSWARGVRGEVNSERR